MRLLTLSAAIRPPSRQSANYRVEAVESSGVCLDLIDVAMTDVCGAFEMQLDADHVARLLPGRRAAVVFRFFDERGKIVPLAHRVGWELSAQVTRLQIPLAAGKGPARRRGRDEGPALLVVRGTLRGEDGEGIGGVKVRAFDREL